MLLYLYNCSNRCHSNLLSIFEQWLQNQGKALLNCLESASGGCLSMTYRRNSPIFTIWLTGSSCSASKYPKLERLQTAFARCVKQASGSMQALGVTDAGVYIHLSNHNSSQPGIGLKLVKPHSHLPLCQVIIPCLNITNPYNYNGMLWRDTDPI